MSDGILLRGELQARFFLNSNTFNVFSPLNTSLQIEVLEADLNRELMHLQIAASAAYDARSSIFDVTLIRKDKSRSFSVQKIDFDYNDEGAVFYSSKWLSSHSFDSISSEDVCSQADEFGTLLDEIIIEVLKPPITDVSIEYSIISQTESSIKVLGVVTLSKGKVSNQVSVNLEVDQCGQFVILDEATVSIADYFDSATVEVHSLEDESHVSNKIKGHVLALVSSDLTFSVSNAGQSNYTIALEIDHLSASVTITPVLSLSQKGQELLNISVFLSTISVPEFYVDDLEDESMILEACQSVLIDSFSESLTVPFTLEFVDMDNVNVILSFEDIKLSTEVSFTSIVLTEAGTKLNNLVNLLKSHDLQLTQCDCHFELKTYTDLIKDSIEDLADLSDLIVDVEYSENSLFKVSLQLGTSIRHTFVEFSCPVFSTSICDNLKSLYISDYKWSTPPLTNSDTKVEMLTARLSSLLPSYSLVLDSVEYVETLENSRNGRFCQSRDHFDINVSSATSDRYVITTSTIVESKVTRIAMFWIWGFCITAVGFFLILLLMGLLYEHWFPDEEAKEAGFADAFALIMFGLAVIIPVYAAYQLLSRHYCSK
ncbi:hypothetical protein GEMRC1_011427 [Eukaryota sp. GEM-RC1]